MEVLLEVLYVDKCIKLILTCVLNGVGLDYAVKYSKLQLIDSLIMVIIIPKVQKCSSQCTGLYS